MVDSINSLRHTQNPKLTKLDGGVTKMNNEFGIFKDSQGNSVYRVDYQNNNPENIYDQEEVRDPDGNLLSYTERCYSADGKMYFEKHIFDENGQVTKILETKCDANGKPIETKEISPDESLFKAKVHIGVPLDGVHGDPGLIEKLTKWGAYIIGRN